MNETQVDALRDQIAQSLRAAMKARDGVAVPALRGLLHAIDNTSAVDASAPPLADANRGEVARRLPTHAELAALIEREADEREAAASLYEGLGESVKAAQLRGEAVVVRGWLATALG